MKSSWLLLLLAGCSRSTTSGETSSPAPLPNMAPEEPHLTTTSSAPIARSALVVTHGEITALDIADGGDRSAMHLRIDRPVVRAVLRAKTRPAIDLRFTYLGPTPQRVALGSGDTRVQIGAKLRAADGCNVVYAMLRIEPVPSLVVQVKHNPSAHTHDDCGTGGYHTIEARTNVQVRPIAPGSSHVLRAVMHERELVVWLDGDEVWRGDLGEEVLTFDGPVGFRTDNGRFDLVLHEAPE